MLVSRVSLYSSSATNADVVTSPEMVPQHDRLFTVETEIQRQFRPLDRLVDSNVVMGRKYCERVKTIVVKEVPLLTVGDVTESGTHRAFCAETGKLLLCMHGSKKNPYRGEYDDNAEREYVREHHYGTGYNDMADFCVREKTLTLSHRHLIQDKERNLVYFNVRLTPKPTVYSGDGDEVCATVIDQPPFLREQKSFVIVDPGLRTLAVVRCPSKPLIVNVGLGIGAEYQVDVAPGVDWTAILAIMQVMIMLNARGPEGAGMSWSSFRDNFSFMTTIGHLLNKID